MLTRGDVPTPALLLDLDAFEHNIQKMAAHLKARNKAFRPHGKTHKCPEVARALIRRRRDRLLRGPAQRSGSVRRVRHPGPADHHRRDRPRQDRARGRAGGQARRTRCSSSTIGRTSATSTTRPAQRRPSRSSWLVDLFFGRTGIAPGQPAVELAQLIESLPNVTFAGLQSYDGAAAHTTPFDARSTRTTTTMGKAVETKAMIERAGIACPLVTGGSTGTYRFDSENPGMTELQPGSFVFMDMEYGTIGGPDGSEYRDFKNALTVVTTVVSRPPGFAIVDGGYKAFSTDRPFTPRPVGIDGVTYGWAGDEHGRLDTVERVARSARSAIASSSFRRTSIPP